jgi:hypothetical protein
MQQFYYDFVDVFVDLRDFQYCVMDTDSAYIALSADTFRTSMYLSLVIWLVLLLIPLQLNLSSFPKQ